MIKWLCFIRQITFWSLYWTDNSEAFRTVGRSVGLGPSPTSAPQTLPARISQTSREWYTTPSSSPFSSAHSSPPSPVSPGSNYLLNKYYQHPCRTLTRGMMTNPMETIPFAATTLLSPSSTFLVRILFLRALALVYGVAFWIAWRQNKALIGDQGITPARHKLQEAEQRGNQVTQRRLAWRQEQQQQVAGQNASVIRSGDDHSFLGRWWTIWSHTKFVRWIGATLDRHPRLLRLREIWWDRTDGLGRPVTTLLWLAPDRNHLDPWLDGLALTGLATAAVVAGLGAANVLLLLILWVCQRSLMAVGGPWYGYGWEPQLAELGFHALLLVPLWSLRSLPSLPPPPVVVWTIRWYLFRIMMGAGLIKIKSSDPKWKNLTTMYYFYETQPVPNPLSRYLHWMPCTWHKGEVLLNHVIELIAPWLLIIPALPIPLRRAGAWIQIVFQVILILSGNLSFLNWLTMIPAVMCLDDAAIGGWFTPAQQQRAAQLAASAQPTAVRQLVSGIFLVLIAKLSVPVVRNLCARRQVMNGSFDPLRLVNTYGAFGVVNEDRHEWIISAAADVAGPWKEYEFQVKPGNIYRHPQFISPYHHRLDWQMWIAASSRSVDRNSWIFRLLLKLLKRDAAVLKLMAGDPWEGTLEKPKYIRIDSYHYKFHRAQNGEVKPPYWDRTFVGRVYPRQGVVTIESLKEAIRRC